MSSKKKQVVEDFLEVDDPIAGQNYVCISFVDPEDIIKNKEAFKTAKFLQSYSKENKLDFNKLYEDYLDFQYKYQDEIQNDYDKENNNVNNVRGVKIRGVYSTKEEAESRSKKIHRNDSTFHVFIGQVGYWLPFNPCADKIEKEEFLDNGLNELMKKYKENNINKDILYEQEKRNKMKQAVEESNKSKENNTDSESDDPNLIIKPIKNKEKTEPEPEPEPESETEPESNIKLDDSKLDDSLKDSLDNVDPWLKNKLSD